MSCPTYTHNQWHRLFTFVSTDIIRDKCSDKCFVPDILYRNNVMKKLFTQREGSTFFFTVTRTFSVISAETDWRTRDLFAALFLEKTFGHRRSTLVKMQKVQWRIFFSEIFGLFVRCYCVKRQILKEIRKSEVRYLNLWISFTWKDVSFLRHCSISKVLWLCPVKKVFAHFHHKLCYSFVFWFMALSFVHVCN